MNLLEYWYLQQYRQFKRHRRYRQYNTRQSTGMRRTGTKRVHGVGMSVDGDGWVVPGCS